MQQLGKDQQGCTGATSATHGNSEYTLMTKNTWARMPRIKKEEAPPRKLLVVLELTWPLRKADKKS